MPSAAILAGGAARRFGGRDKSGLIVEGRTILARQIEELATITDDILIVGPPREPCDDRRGVRRVDDRVPGCGPLGGLDAALAAARDDLLIAVACDMPFVTAAFLRHLIVLADESGDTDAVVPLTERGYHPVCAAYRRTCRSAVQDALAEGRLSMIKFLQTMRVRVVREDEIEAFGPVARLLANVNTSADLDALDALSRHEP